MLESWYVVDKAALSAIRLSIQAFDGRSLDIRVIIRQKNGLLEVEKSP